VFEGRISAELKLVVGFSNMFRQSDEGSQAGIDAHAELQVLVNPGRLVAGSRDARDEFEILVRQRMLAGQCAETRIQVTEGSPSETRRTWTW
jgi:hypothetical protein